MASAPDPTCAPAPVASSLPAVDQEQEVSKLHTFNIYIHQKVKCGMNVKHFYFYFFFFFALLIIIFLLV